MAANSRASTPETTGAAMEVPLNVAYSLDAPVERISAPGAEMFLPVLPLAL